MQTWTGPCRCERRQGGVSMLDLGNGIVVGVTNLCEAMGDLAQRGHEPAQEVGEELLAAIEAHNYVPTSASERHKVAL